MDTHSDSSFIFDSTRGFEPAQDCRLFEKSVGGVQTMPVNGVHGFLDYVIGYETGVRRLYESFKRDYNSSLVYPIVFLFRHSVELNLKYLLRVARHYLRKTASEADVEREKSHSLDRLWQNLLPMIVEIFPNGDRAWDKKAGRLIRQLDDMDRRAQEFRYPRTTEGVRNLQSFYSFDLTNFVQHAEWLHGYFGGTGDAMMADIEAGPEGGVFF